MNYLAHLYLAEDTPESILGNFLGDFVKGSAINPYSAGIKKGIEIHRKIDAFTDSHPIFKESKSLISQTNQRYAGILIDIFYDHFLAKQWSDYSLVALNDFTAKVYILLEDHETILPEVLRKILPKLKSENWLMSYADISGISITLQKVSRRLKRQNSLDNAVEELSGNYYQLQNKFQLFFPELIKYTRTLV